MALNSNVVFVRGLSAEEHRMLSAKASNTPLRTVNAFVLALIRETLGTTDPASRRPGENRVAAKLRSERIPGWAAPARDPRSPKSWTRAIGEALEIPGQPAAEPVGCQPHRDLARCIAAGHWPFEPRSVEVDEAEGT